MKTVAFCRVFDQSLHNASLDLEHGTAIDVFLFGGTISHDRIRYRCLLRKLHCLDEEKDTTVIAA